MPNIIPSGILVAMSKSASPIPPGFHAITPHLNVEGAAAYIDFLTRAFGAVEISRSPGPGGKLMHVQMRIGDSMLMFADDFSAEFGMPPFAKGNLPFVLHLYVPDADATWNQAVAAGCEVKMPISDQFWGDRYGHVRDPFGMTWAIASHKEDLTPQEMEEKKAKLFGGAHP
jgi:PhnB protein